MTTSRMTGLPGRSPQQPRQRNWPVPAALLLVSVIPVLAGALRLVQLLGGPALIPAVHRFEGFPLPLIVHIVSATLFAVVGAFEFVSRFRRQHRNWHRRAGRVLHQHHGVEELPPDISHGAGCRGGQLDANQ